MILRKEHRCIHDFIANTIVIKAKQPCLAKVLPASKIERLFARIADNLVYLVPISMINNESIFTEFSAMMGVTILSCILVVQMILLTRDGQTLGKKLFGLKIVLEKTKKNGGFATNVLLRTACNMLLSFIPLYSLVDALFIFRKDQRCIHDLLAKTIVIKIQSVSRILYFVQSRFTSIMNYRIGWEFFVGFLVNILLEFR